MVPLVFICIISELPICIVLLAVVVALYPIAIVLDKLVILATVPALSPIATFLSPVLFLYNAL